jgi:PEGA domain
MRNAWLLLSVLATAALAQTGCVERRYVIVTEPPGAVVERNGQLLGATPADDHFVYYGKYLFKIVKPGYETLQVVQNIPSPWYEWPGIDFFSENIWPFYIIDRREFHYQLVPLMQPQTNDLLRQAENLRNRGKSVQPPPGVVVPAPPGPTTPASAPPPALGPGQVPPPTLQPPVGVRPMPAGPLPSATVPQPGVTPGIAQPSAPTLQPPMGTGPAQPGAVRQPVATQPPPPAPQPAGQ